MKVQELVDSVEDSMLRELVELMGLDEEFLEEETSLLVKWILMKRLEEIGWLEKLKESMGLDSEEMVDWMVMKRVQERRVLGRVVDVGGEVEDMMRGMYMDLEELLDERGEEDLTPEMLKRQLSPGMLKLDEEGLVKLREKEILEWLVEKYQDLEGANGNGDLVEDGA